MNSQQILTEAGKVLKRRYFEKQNYEVKERYHLLSRVDLEMDDYISSRLSEHYPDYSIYSEESEEIKRDARARWILDPIDGTTNFIMGNPFFAISLALELDGQILEGHVYNPVSDEYFFASANDENAYMNDEKIHPSQTDTISDALIAFGYSANMPVIEEYYSAWKTVFDDCRKGIGWVAPALSICNVARGRIDAFIDTGCSMEGQSAAGFILQKAGGRLFDNRFRGYDHTTKGAIFCSRAIEWALRKAFARGNH